MIDLSQDIPDDHEEIAAFVALRSPFAPPRPHPTLPLTRVVCDDHSTEEQIEAP